MKALQPKIRAIDARMREQFGVRLGLIAIDTMAGAFAMKDENDAAEAQQVLRHMRMLGEPIGALVLPIHHYGKTEDTGLRGSTAPPPERRPPCSSTSAASSSTPLRCSGLSQHFDARDAAQHHSLHQRHDPDGKR